MESKKFDNLIKSKLEGLENLSSISDWDMFHSKYKNELADKSEFFDRVIQEKFDGLQVPYNKKHWYLMKEALEREEFIRTSIYFSKIVEAGCIFLILFTFLNLFPTFSENSGLQKRIQDKPFIADGENSIDQQLFEFSLKTNNEGHNNSKFKIASTVSEEKISNDASVIIVDNSTQIKSNKLIFNELSNSESNNLYRTEYRNSTGIINNKTPDLDENFAPNINTKEVILFNTAITEATLPTEERMTYADIASLEGNQITPLELKETFYIPIFPLSYSNNSKNEKYMSFAFAPTVNIVNSPFDYINKTEPYSTDALGGELGINYSVRKDNLEIETGLNYGRKSYQPKQVDEIIGSFITSFRRLRLRQITYDVMSIPMNIKYHFKSNDSWSFYALTGTSLNGIANSDYLVEENGSKISIYNVQTNYRESNTAKKSYNPGILEGGNVLDNLYFTLDLAIGFEKKFNASTSFFFAPTLRQHLGLAGVGPNNDKVNSLGLNLGIKKKL
jgi:hypothetical protein